MEEGRQMRNSCWIVLAAVTAVLFGLPGSRAGDDKARELFDKMERKLTGAKTLKVEVDAKLEDDSGKSSLKSTLWIAAGNKLRAEYQAKLDGKEEKVTIISDGNKLIMNQAEFGSEESDTPKNLQEDMSLALARVGVYPASIFMVQVNKVKSTKARETIKVSDLKLGKREKINDRETQAFEYQVTYPMGEGRAKVTLWVDVKTNLPIRRVLTAKGTYTENLTFQVNLKIADEKFQLPK
jgi:outer membrane lipoprotein-sorting protein